MTQIESKPTSSASRHDAREGRPDAPRRPPGQVNERICRPTFIGRRVAHSARHVAGAGRGQRKRSISAGMTRSRMRPSPAWNVAPRTSASGRRAVLPSASSAAEASSSATARTVELHDPAVGVGRAAQVLERQQPGDADRDVDDAEAPRPAEAVGDDDRQVMAEPVARRRRGSGRRTRPGRAGSSVTTSPESGPTFEASMPPLAHTKPCGVSVMTTPLSIRTTRAPRAGRPRPGARRGRSVRRTRSASGRGSIVGQVDDRALGLGHDLLGDDEDVVVAQRQDAPGVAASASAMSAGQVVARARSRRGRRWRRPRPGRLSHASGLGRPSASASSRSSGVSRSSVSGPSSSTTVRAGRRVPRPRARPAVAAEARTR